MKKSFIFSSFLAVALSMGMTSCSEIANIDDPIELPKIDMSDLAIAAKSVVDIPASQGAANAKTVNIKNDQTFEKVITMSDGTFIAYLKSQTRAAANLVTGKYEVKGNMIVCTIPTVGGLCPVIEIPVGVAETAIINGTTVECEEEAKLQETPQLVSLCRTWYPTKYQAVVYSDEGTVSHEKKIFGNYEATKLAQLEQTIEKESKTDINLLDGELEKFSFLSDGTLVTTYADKCNSFTWEWTAESKGEFKASFGNDAKFQNLPSFVRYQAGTTNIAEFVLECQVEVKGKNNENVNAIVKAIITAKDTK